MIDARRRCGRGGVAAICAAVVAVVAAGCGSSDSDTQSSKSGAKSLGTVKVVVAAPSLDFANLFIADAAGLFKQQGVDVKISSNTGSATLPTISSGRADLTEFTAPSALIAAQKGFGSRMVYLARVNSGGALISTLNNISELQKMKSCRLASLVQGSIVWAIAQQIKSALHLNCSISAVATADLAVTGAASGFYQGAILTYEAANTAATTHDKLHMLIDPDQFESGKFPPVRSYPSVGLWGLEDWLSSHRDQTAAFLKAVIKADAMLKDQPIDDLVKLLRKEQPFAATPTAVLAAGLKLSLRDYDKPGEITQEAWERGLQGWTGWSTPGYDKNDPKNAYDKRVDMSYYHAAIGQ